MEPHTTKEKGKRETKHHDKAEKFNTQATYQNINRQIKKSSRKDKRDYYNNLADIVQQAAERGNM